MQVAVEKKRSECSKHALKITIKFAIKFIIEIAERVRLLMIM